MPRILLVERRTDDNTRKLAYKNVCCLEYTTTKKKRLLVGIVFYSLSPTTTRHLSVEAPPQTTLFCYYYCLHCVCVLASLSFFSKRTNAFFRCRLVNIMWHNFFSLHKNRERAIVDWFGCIIFFRFLFYFLLSIFFSYLQKKSWKKRKIRKRVAMFVPLLNSKYHLNAWAAYTTTTQSSGLLYLGIYLYFYMKLVIIIRTVTGLYIVWQM